MSRWNKQSMHTDLGSFSDNPKVRKQLRERRIRIAVVIGVLVLVLALGTKPAYRAYRNRVIDGNLEEAQVAARLEDWPKARAKARSVLLARPGDYQAFRIWTIALGHIGEPRTYLAAAMMFTNPAADRDDQLKALRIMARQAPEAVALSAYLSLPEEVREEREFMTAVAPLMTRRGGAEVVAGQLREVEGAAADPLAQLELVRAYCSRPTAENVAAARKVFAGMLESPAVVPTLEALELLGETAGGLDAGDDLPRLPLWVERQPEAKTIHHLLALHPAIDAAPGVANEWYQGAIERFADVDPGVLGTWLVRQGEAERAVKMLEEPAKTRADAYISYLHALMRSEREGDLDKALAEPPAAADLVEVELVRAALARRRGDQPAATAAWTRAMNQAAFDGSRNRFLEIARYAGLLQAESAADDAWVAAIRIGWGPIPLYRDLRPRLARLAMQGRSEDLLAISRTLLRFEPENAELINNFFYLGLLHELVEPTVAVAALQALLEEHPDRPEFTSALALAHLEQGDATAALALMPTIRASERVTPMMADAIEGTALALADRADEGRALWQKVDWRAFMRSERMAFKRLLLRKQIADLPLPLMEEKEMSEAPDEIPEWRKAVEKLEKARENDVLPALPAVEMPAMPELE